MTATRKFDSTDVKTKYRVDDIEGQDYHVVTVAEDVNLIMPAPFIGVLTRKLQEPNFAFGLVDGLFTFVFRSRRDAQTFRQMLRQVA